MLTVITNQLQDILCVEKPQEFQSNFFADALVMSFQRWILEYDQIQASEFIEQLKVCVQYFVVGYDEID